VPSSTYYEVLSNYGAKPKAIISVVNSIPTVVNAIISVVNSIPTVVNVVFMIVKWLI
jgi:hypothetical protein